MQLICIRKEKLDEKKIKLIMEPIPPEVSNVLLQYTAVLILVQSINLNKFHILVGKLKYKRTFATYIQSK